MRETKISVSLPKFEFSTKYELSDILQNLGMKKAFTPGVADFSGMSSNGKSLFISAVLHQAYIKVDEEGTEAAAATVVVISKTTAAITFRADHPFIFIIQERKTGNILFIGRVVDPTSI